MKRSSKYVALDVHQATTSATVRGDGGRVIARTTLPTTAPGEHACNRTEGKVSCHVL